MAAQLGTISPSYCPCCQRLFRVTPANYSCPADETPLIDVGDPIPPTRLEMLMPAGVTLTVLTMVTGGIVVF